MSHRRLTTFDSQRRRYFIGGSDARVIMGNDEAALMRPVRSLFGRTSALDARDPARTDRSSRTEWRRDPFYHRPGQTRATPNRITHTLDHDCPVAVRSGWLCIRFQVRRLPSRQAQACVT